MVGIRPPRPKKEDVSVRADYPLSPKQLRFVEEFCLDPSSPTRAALRAGYSDSSATAAGSYLIRDQRVKELIKKNQDRVIKKFSITEDRILQELASIAFARPETSFVLDEDGQPRIDYEHMSRDDKAALELTINTTGSGEKKIKTVQVKTVRTADRIAALEKIGKHIGMFADKLEVKTTLTLADLIEKSFRLEDKSNIIDSTATEITPIAEPVLTPLEAK